MRVCFLLLPIIYLLFSCEKPGNCPDPLGKVILQPDSIAGNDAYLGSISPGTNYGADSKIYAHAWTYSGNPSNIYFLLQFDYSSLPLHFEVTSATLSLFADTSNSFSGSPAPVTGHFGGGADSTYLKRVTSRWDENSVSWSTRPTSTTVNKIKFPPTKSNDQAFIIDVTKIVQDQIKFGNYGFEFGLQQYMPYQRLVFYSSESSFSNLRPKLVINYKKLN